ncbi:hypothetical protein QTO34_001732 [Cnephaeus nilssonii]|uniref:Uncharacterized protein n=1 Tax=Cnephaeus nilssonii TaxID=3371016 RepID=A0AA40LL78_CNENI|nr:hypothetical protein QTO34_001732 [Eptesicus nilssonii]
MMEYSVSGLDSKCTTGIVTRVDGLGADVSRTDPLGRLALQLIEKKTSFIGRYSDQEPSRLKIETGYGDMNAWVEWGKFMVQALNKSDCFACAAGRPQPQVVPSPLGWDTDPEGMYCMPALYQDKNAWGNEACRSLSLLFPTLQRSDPKAIPSFSIGNVNYSSCLSRQGAEFTRPMGELTTCTDGP